MLVAIERTACPAARWVIWAFAAGRAASREAVNAARRTDISEDIRKLTFRVFLGCKTEKLTKSDQFGTTKAPKEKLGKQPATEVAAGYLHRNIIFRRQPPKVSGTFMKQH
jgi:hypothetical protein